MTATLRPRRLVAPPVPRLVAASIDLAIVALPSLAVALLAAERFALVGPDGEPNRFSATDQARIDEMGDGLHRAVEVGGWLYALDAVGLLVTVVVVTGAAVLAHVAMPVLGGGRSPGKAVVGLRVVATDGGPADMGSHLIRTMAVPIDLLGLVVPGLLGTLLAWRDADRRRLGDRLAETRVTRWPNEWLVTETTVSSNQTRGPHHTPWSIGPDNPARTAWPEDSDPHGVPVAILLTDADSDSGADWSDVSTGAVATDPPEPAPPLPQVRRVDGSPTRSPRSRRGATRADVEAMAAARTAPAPEAGWLGATADYANWAEPTGHLLDATDVRAEGIRGSSTTDRFATLLLPESSLAEGPLITTTPAAAEDRMPEARDDDLVIEADPAGQPMWDRNQEAWVYRDRERGRWFRHDATTDRWVPISTDDDPPACT